MAQALFTNNASSTLATTITAIQTTISVAVGDGALFPSPTGADWAPITMVDASGNMEIMQCTSRTGDTLTVVRGQEGTTAFAFVAGDRVDNRLTSASYATKANDDEVLKIASNLSDVGDTITAVDNLINKGATIASAATINLTTATGAFVEISGTTTVTAVTLAEGAQRIARATGAFKLTAGSSLIINGSTSVDYTVNAGDLLMFVGYASSVVHVMVISAQAPQQVSSINGGPLGGFRNKIINGDFDVWQEGISFSSPAFNAYDSDLWSSAAFSGTISTISRKNFTVGQTDVPGNPRYYSRMSITSAGNVTRSHKIEGVWTFSGETATFTAYMRTSVATNSNLSKIYLIQRFGSGGSPSAAVFSSTLTGEAIGTSWTKISATVAIPSITGKTIGSNGDSYLEVRMDISTSFVGDWDVAHVSLVKGDATNEDDPAPRPNPAITEMLCQRYYWKFYRGSASTLLLLAYRGTNLLEGSLFFPTSMRAVPTLSYSGTPGLLGTGAESLSSITALSDVDSSAISWNDTGTPFSVGQTFGLGSSTLALEFDARL